MEFSEDITSLPFSNDWNKIPRPPKILGLSFVVDRDQASINLEVGLRELGSMDVGVDVW
jgi:hypothetical protein